MTYNETVQKIAELKGQSIKEVNEEISLQVAQARTNKLFVLPSDVANMLLSIAEIEAQQ